MLFLGNCQNKDIAHVDANYSSIDQIPKELIHHCLKCYHAIAESKEHNEGFKQAPVGTECRFPLVSGFDADIVVSPADIEFAEPACIPCLLDDFCN